MFNNGVGDQSGSASTLWERYRLTLLTADLMYCADSKSLALATFLTQLDVFYHQGREMVDRFNLLLVQSIVQSFSKDFLGFARNDQAIFNIQKHPFIFFHPQG